MDRRVWRWARSVRAHMVRAPSRGPFFGFGGKGGVRVESVVGDCTRSRVATYQETLLRPSLSYTADEVDLNEATHPHTQTRLTAHLTRRSSGNAPDGDRRRSLGQTSPLECSTGVDGGLDTGTRPANLPQWSLASAAVRTRGRALTWPTSTS